MQWRQRHTNPSDKPEIVRWLAPKCGARNTCKSTGVAIPIISAIELASRPTFRSSRADCHSPTEDKSSVDRQLSRQKPEHFARTQNSDCCSNNCDAENTRTCVPR